MGCNFSCIIPEITPGVEPKVRFMSAYEQRIEEPDKQFQYLLIAAEPYETCAFKLQAKEIDRRGGEVLDLVGWGREGVLVSGYIQDGER